MGSLGSTRATAAAVVVFACALSSSALAQRRRRPAPPPDPPAAKPAEQPAPARSSPTMEAAEMFATAPGGISAEQVGTRSMGTSFTVRSAVNTAEARAALARAAWLGYLPRVTLKGAYTRHSKFTFPSFGGANSVATTAPPGTLNPTETFVQGGFIFPQVFNIWLLQAMLTVPISDYLFKTGHTYAAATEAQDAAAYDTIAARAKAYTDAKVLYYNWLHDRGNAWVAQESLEVAKAHLKDSQNQFNVGNSSKADVLRAETAVAVAELALAKAKSAIVLAERRVRVAMHAKEEEHLEPGESIDSALKPLPPDLRGLIAEAESTRPELKALAHSAESARRQASATRAGYWPALSGFVEGTEGNPNVRRFPQTQDWFGTWSAGATLSWSPNDVLAAGPGANDAEARSAALEAQKLAKRDEIDVEVTKAYQAVFEADTAMETTGRQLESALEAYRVARELYNAGRGTGTTLLDAEKALAQARFDFLNARIDARITRINLDHAVGRDLKIAASVAP